VQPAYAAPVRTGPDVATSPIAWKTVDGIKAGDRPLLVWIADAALHTAAEHRAFDDTDVRLASHAFRIVRISPEDARTDAILATHAASAPVLLLFAPDLSRATVVSGSSLDPRSVIVSMRSSAATYLRIDLGSAVTQARTLLDERKTLETERATLSRTPPAEPEAARRRARLGAIDARLTAISAEVDGLFR
jgi:hypothetical protein